MDRNNWELGISTWFFENEYSIKTLTRAYNAGIKSLELSLEPFELFSDTPYQTVIKNHVDMAREVGFRINSYHLPFSDTITLVSDDKKIIDNSIETYKKQIIEASINKIPICIIHPSNDYVPSNRTETLKNVKNILSELATFALENNVKLAVENLPRTCLANVSKEMEFLLKDNKDLFACFDSNHCLTEDNCNYIKTMGSKLIALHIADYDRVNERHWMPLKGVNDWVNIIKTLEEIDYKGDFTYEVGPCEAGYAEHFKNNMNTIFNLK